MNSLLARSVPLLRQLEEKGFECVFVGGVVRDLLLARPPEDVDIATDAPLSLLREFFPQGNLIGPEEKSVFVVPLEGRPCEITSYFGRSLEHDLSRRDFTVNALALRSNGELVASFLSRRDVARRVLRFNGRCADRLAEDPIRALRLARFAATLPGFGVHESVFAGIRSVAPSPTHSAPERVGREIRLGLEGDSVRFIESLSRSRMLHFLSPALGSSFFAARHLLVSLKRLDDRENSLIRRTALLFSFCNDCLNGETERRVRTLLRRWGWRKEVRDSIAALVRFRTLPYGKLSPEEMAVHLLEKGAGFWESLFAVADARAFGERRRRVLNRTLFAGLVVRQSSGETLMPSGGELMKHLSLPSGPKVGRLLRVLAIENMLGGFSSREQIFERAAALASEMR